MHSESTDTAIIVPSLLLSQVNNLNPEQHNDLNELKEDYEPVIDISRTISLDLKVPGLAPIIGHPISWKPIYTNDVAELGLTVNKTILAAQQVLDQYTCPHGKKGGQCTDCFTKSSPVCSKCHSTRPYCDCVLVNDQIIVSICHPQIPFEESINGTRGWITEINNNISRVASHKPCPHPYFFIDTKHLRRYHECCSPECTAEAMSPKSVYCSIHNQGQGTGCHCPFTFPANQRGYGTLTCTKCWSKMIRRFRLNIGSLNQQLDTDNDNIDVKLSDEDLANHQDIPSSPRLRAMKRIPQQTSSSTSITPKRKALVQLESNENLPLLPYASNGQLRRKRKIDLKNPLVNGQLPLVSVVTGEPICLHGLKTGLCNMCEQPSIGHQPTSSLPSAIPIIDRPIPDPFPSQSNPVSPTTGVYQTPTPNNPRKCTTLNCDHPRLIGSPHCAACNRLNDPHPRPHGHKQPRKTLAIGLHKMCIAINCTQPRFSKNASYCWECSAIYCIVKDCMARRWHKSCVLCHDHHHPSHSHKCVTTGYPKQGGCPYLLTTTIPPIDAQYDSISSPVDNRLSESEWLSLFHP